MGWTFHVLQLSNMNVVIPLCFASPYSTEFDFVVFQSSTWQRRKIFGSIVQWDFYFVVRIVNSTRVVLCRTDQYRT